MRHAVLTCIAVGVVLVAICDRVIIYKYYQYSSVAIDINHCILT